MASATGKEHHRQTPGVDGRGLLGRLALVGPLLALAGSVIGLTGYCRYLLVEAESGRDASVGTGALYVGAGGFMLATAAVIVLQAARVCHRVAGPEFRLRTALARIRSGDLSFRVHLRRGDLLAGLADECNELIEWLNRNPPAGATTGTDVVEIGELRLDAGVDADEHEVQEVGSV